jgi:polyisoprenoid-binding protein YceI
MRARTTTGTRIRAALLAGCAVALVGAGPAPALGQGVSEWAVDHTASSIWVTTESSGLLGFLGHDHAILPADWSAELCLTEPLGEGSRATLTLATASLEIDTEAALAVAGMDDGPGEEDRREIREKMLSPRYLAAEEHPEIRLEVRATGPVQEGRLPARATLHARGASVEVEVPVEVGRDGERMTFRGEAEVLQTELGMEPESVAGVVNVANEVTLHFDLVAEPTGGRCGEAGER